MYCRKCGNKLEEGSAFCNYCGTQVITDKPSEEKEAVAEQEPVQEEVAKEVPSNTAKRSMKLPLIIGLGAAAVALVAGVVIFKPFGLFKTGTNDDGTIAGSDIGETASETAISVGVDVLDYDGHSFACFFGCSTWEEARDQCEGMGGHLAVITSQEEDEALFAFTRYCGYDNVYIGYSDIEEEGNWQWVTGETSDYSNWNEGEPNGFTPNENYAVYGDNGAWYDGEFTPRIENGLISFICEWDYHVDGATNISSEELQTYIDGLEAVAIETEPVVETLSQTDVNRIAAYAGYLDYLEASESPIRSCNMYDQKNCALADVTGDGIEELFVFKQHYYGYTFLEVMTYDFSAGEVRSILSTDNNWDFYYLYMFAISNAGNLIICNYSYQACPLNAYFVYTYDGNALVETEALFHSGIEWGYEGSERYVACEEDYRINRDYVTENEYSNREAEILNSISSILVDSVYWNNIQGDPDVVEVMDTNQMNAVVSSVEKIAMTYDEMHALLMSYT